MLSKPRATADNVILTNFISRLFARSRAVDHGAVEELLQRGYCCQQAGEREVAERIYLDALKIDACHADANYLLGALLGESSRFTEAAALLDRALASKPDFAAAHAARGNVFLMLGAQQAAVASYEQALRLDPDNAAAHFNLGLIWQTTGAREQALIRFERAHALAPEIPDLLKNLTLSYLETERYEDAQAVLQGVLAQTPRRAEALKCLGLVLQKLHRPQEALQHYLTVRAIDGTDAELLNNLGIVFQDLGRLDEAVAAYDAAIALKPDFTLALWHRSLAYLLQHDFARGWPDYELRLTSADRPQRAAVFPSWDGSVLAGKKMLVHAEQGLGDEIMFASCIPDLLAAGARCVIECSPKLELMFRRSFPQAVVYAANPAKALPPGVGDAGIDLQSSIGSLPQHVRRTRADFPQHSGYLRAEPQAVAVWGERLAALGRGLKVGISWQGGTHKSRRPVRSMPLAQWLPILQLKGAHFVDLQYTDCRAEIDQLRAATGVVVHSWDEVRTDYEQTAALVTALDLVISVCTAVIHLGGALGTPVWVMAPYSPEWRYGIAGPQMPWYPSVRVFRQSAYGEWGAVIDDVAQSLRDRTSNVAPAQAARPNFRTDEPLR